MKATGLRVMIVDDNVDAATVLAALLELMLLRPISIEHDPVIALQRAVVEEPDVLILDIGMPKLDGYELARRLRSLPQTANATLIALTGYGQASDREKALSSGFDYHLVKPPKMDELLAAITSGKQG